MGGIHHAAQLRCRPDDDVHHAALRCAAAGGGDVHVHELRRDDPVLRDRGPAGPGIRGRPVARAARQRPRALPVRSLPRQPHDHRRHRRADGNRDLLPAAGARSDPPDRRIGRAPEPAGGASGWSASERGSTTPTRASSLSTAPAAGWPSSGPPSSRPRPTPTSCSPATSRSAPSGCTPTSWTSC